jgi:hypothetical protein
MKIFSARYLLFAVLMITGSAVAQESPPSSPDPVPAEEYPIYDRVVQAKFLTSQTMLVMIDRLTVTRVGEEEKPLLREFFDEHQFFDGQLQPALLTDFLVKFRRPSTLEPKFNFGVRYRLVSPHERDGDEVSLRTVPVRSRLIDVSGPTIMLEFSRVAFTPRRDQALVYVGNHRPDGTGAGFLVWLRWLNQAWDIMDTEVIWIAPTEER